MASSRLAGLFALAILGGATAAEAQTVRDSAGVRIVNTPLPSRQVVLTEPTLSIGGVEVDEPYEFFQIVGAVRFANGNIAVATQGSYSVRFYNPPYTAVIVDEATRVWIQRYPRATKQETVLDVIDGKGNALATVRIPRRLEVYNVKDGHLIARWQDALGVEYIHVYKIPALS